MQKINRILLEQEAKKKNSKNERVFNNKIVSNITNIALSNLKETIFSSYTYNVAHWCINIDRWQQNLKNINVVNYKRGDIIFLDLGAQNFAHEPSYTHACIVLANKYDSILIVPCSTKQFGTNHPGIIDATKMDGFVKNTGIQSFNFRWVSKNRVVSKTGKKVSPSILNKLDNVMFSFAPSIKCLIKQKDKKIEELVQQIAILKEKLKNFNVKNFDKCTS